MSNSPFQKPPFDFTAFQEGPSFSLGAFQACAFQYPGFQVDRCKWKAQPEIPEEGGRSGWYRLMLAQIQAESLNADEKRRKEKEEREQEQGQEAAQRAGIGTQEKSAVPAKRARAKPRRAAEPEDEDEPAFNLKALFRPAHRPSPLPPSLQPLLRQAETEAAAARAELIILRSRIDEIVANDDDDEDDMLLLLAA